MLQNIVLATANQGKVQEMADVLNTFGFNVLSQKQFNIVLPEEIGLTFVENALLKARHASKISGLPSIADDSGLVVDALDGAPGLYSARYAGVDGDDARNRAKLLADLTNIENRQAAFVCVIVLLRHSEDPMPIIAQGRCEGIITHAELGSNGFGYDSVFLYPPSGLTFAEMSSLDKKQVSHRAQALASLKQQLTI